MISWPTFEQGVCGFLCFLCKTLQGTANPERADRLGTLLPSGLIVGESLWGVVNAGLVYWGDTESPLGIVPADFMLAPWLGPILFVAGSVSLYGWMLRRSRAQ